MSRVGKKIIISFIIIAAVAQSLAIYKFNEIMNSKSVIVQSNTNMQKDLLDLYEELNSLKSSKIISANKIDEKWYIKLQIEGDKEHILSELSKLQAYNISDYSINHNTDISEVIVEISDKNNV